MRHGITPPEERARLDAEDMAEAEKWLASLPADEAEAVRPNLEYSRERRWWRGDDWPRPNPGESPDSVAIVGFGPARLVAPYGEPGWELWCLNDPDDREGLPARHAFTRWFQLHPPHYLKKHYERGMDDLARHWGEPTGLRLYMDRHYPEYPDSEPYPKAEVEALGNHGWFHASSFDWMVGLAILEGFKRIDLCGVEFYAFPVMNREPISALYCLHYWLGMAEGRGIDLNVVGRCGHVFRTIHLSCYTSDLQYGFEREPALDLGVDVDPSWSDVR